MAARLGFIAHSTKVYEFNSDKLLREFFRKLLRKRIKNMGIIWHENGRIHPREKNRYASRT